MELISEAVSRSGRVAEVVGSSILHCRAKVVCLSQNVALIDFRCLEVFDFLATVLVRGGGGKETGGSISDGSGIRMGLWVLAVVIAGATGVSDRGGL